MRGLAGNVNLSYRVLCVKYIVAAGIFTTVGLKN